MRDTKTYRGLVVEALPATAFRVKILASDPEEIVICIIAGKMYKNYVRVVPGDGVDVVLSPTRDRGRIVKRYQI